MVVWRWYDAVVLGEEAADSVRLWEPAHGEVVAERRRSQQRPRPTCWRWHDEPRMRTQPQTGWATGLRRRPADERQVDRRRDRWSHRLAVKPSIPWTTRSCSAEPGHPAARQRYRRDRQRQPSAGTGQRMVTSTAVSAGEWFDTTMTAMRGTDPDTELRYVEALGGRLRGPRGTHGTRTSSARAVAGRRGPALSPNDLRAGPPRSVCRTHHSVPAERSILHGSSARHGSHRHRPPISLVTAQIGGANLPIGRPVPSTELTIGSLVARRTPSRRSGAGAP